ncbi:MAG: leucine-rich repeat domain-containing protein [Bacteroidales bacterium]|nr:leucine-rich repeat domain-containing protein [Bacteroidales bacterium]
MASIIDKGHITLQDGSVMTWCITDDEVLTISGALWDGPVTVGKDIKSDAKFRHLVLDDSVKAIGSFNFSDWDQLEEVTLPPSITCIPHAAFSGCKNLKRVNLPEGLETIGADSFLSCESLETINLPGSLKEILEFAFSGTGIAEVIAPWNEPITIEMESFPEDTIIRVPKEALKAYSKADGWKDYTLLKQ